MAGFRRTRPEVETLKPTPGGFVFRMKEKCPNTRDVRGLGCAPQHSRAFGNGSESLDGPYGQMENRGGAIWGPKGHSVWILISNNMLHGNCGGRGGIRTRGG